MCVGYVSVQAANFAPISVPIFKILLTIGICLLELGGRFSDIIPVISLSRAHDSQEALAKRWFTLEQSISSSWFSSPLE